MRHCGALAAFVHAKSKCLEIGTEMNFGEVFAIRKNWWTRQGSNLRRLACKAGDSSPPPLIARGHLKQTTDPEVLIDALSRPPLFRWLQGHAPLESGFAEHIFKSLIPAFEPR